MEKLLDAHDKELSGFHRQVYEYCAKVPKGKVTTYKELAKAVGRPQAVRAVGSALRRNPFAPAVPCHRVVASDRSLGGFQGSTQAGGCCLKRKLALLREEGVRFLDGAPSKKPKVAEECVHTFASA
eukprot:gnl/Hemi2/11517_TR3975_c0_g2_i1.p2 gnl/Hemi2/11517_TR3975_c0_g2~~gnl/Hemi2/11517_TR3975_c0_g2_i1.p2  ORF type:complete len:133 (-),score=37.74 gnl/Hemi2/11517_TR3975_c0_g2_i1:70-447(-)